MDTVLRHRFPNVGRDLLAIHPRAVDAGEQGKLASGDKLRDRLQSSGGSQLGQSGTRKIEKTHCLQVSSTRR